MKRFCWRCIAILLGIGLTATLAGSAWADPTFPEPAVPTEWRSLDTAGLRQLAEDLAAEGEDAKDNRVLLVQYVAYRYLNDRAATLSVGVEGWQVFCLSFDQDMSKATTSLWLGRLQAAYAATQEDLVALTPGGFVVMLRLFPYLADTDLPAIAVAWANASNNWKSLEPKDLVGFHVCLEQSGDGGRAARQSVVEHVAATYIPDPALVKAVGPEGWGSLARSAKKELSKEAQAAWVASLRAAFAGDPTELKPNEVYRLGRALQLLGDAELPELVLSWLNASTSLDGCGHYALAWLAASLPGSGEGLRAAQIRLAGVVASDYLGSNEAARKLAASRWSRLAQVLGVHLPSETQALWRDRLKAAFLDDPAAAGTLTADERISLAVAFDRLKGTEATTPIVDLLSEPEETSKIPAGDLAQLVWQAAKTHKTQLVPLMEGFDTAWNAAFGAGEADFGDCFDISGAWRAVGNREKARQWATRAYQQAVGSAEARDTVDAFTLSRLARMLRALGVAADGGDFTAFATAVARITREDAADTDGRRAYLRDWASLLREPQARQIIEAELTDAEGVPRPAVAKVLAWIAREGKKLDAWRARVDQEIAVAGSNADRKALWLMIKGCTEPLVEETINPLRGKPWLDSALATAESDAVRLQVVREYVVRYQETRRPGIGVGLLDSIENQFTGDELAVVREMRSVLQAQQSQRKANWDRSQASAEVARKKGRLAYYRKRLAAYQAEGDQQDKVTQLQAAIDELEQELQP